MNKIMSLSASLLLIISCVSCTEKKSADISSSSWTEPVVVSQTIYKEENIPLPEDFASLTQLYSSGGEVLIIYRSDLSDSSYSIARYDSELDLLSTTELFSEDINECAAAFAPDGSFALLLIFADYDKYPIEDYEDYFANAVVRFELRRYDAQGGLNDTIELDGLNDYYTFGQSFFSEFAFWGDRIVIGLEGKDSGYLLLDGSGNVTDELSTNTHYAFVEDSEGKLIMSAFEDYTEMDAPSLKYPSAATAFGEYSFRTGDMFTGTEDFRFYAELGDGIYGITQHGDSVKVLDYNSSRIVSSEIRGIVNISEGKFALVGCSNSGRSYLSLLTVRPDDYIEERQKVIFGVNFNDTTLSAEYNRKSDRFEVETKVYADDDALKSAILADEAPDVYNFYDISSVYKFANFGALADMYELSEQYGGFTKDDILDNVAAACEYKGGLYCIPSLIMIDARFADRNVIGMEHQNWTLDEFFEIAENIPEGMYLGDQWSFDDREEVFQFLVSQNLTQWVDFERAACSFDSDKFVHTLEFCRGVNILPDYMDKVDAGLSDEDRRLDEAENIYRLRKGESLLGFVNAGDIGEFRSQAAHYMYELDEVTLLGAPSDDGGGMIRFGNGIYSVFGCGNCPEGGWDFLNYLISYDKQTEFEYGFYSRKDSFEHNARYRMEQASKSAEEYGLTSAGFNNYEIEYDPTITEEQYQEFCGYLATCTHIYGGYSDIESILMEEYDKFIGGEMTAQQCADLIQDRVSIYLSETS